MSTEGPPAGIECPNCHVRTEGLAVQERRKATKRHGVGFWFMVAISLGTWAIWRAIFGRKQIIRSYTCPECRYEWTP